MCEAETTKIPGWKGWLDLPTPKISGASGPWIDLSHRLTEELSRIPSFPQPHIRQISRIPEHRANVTEVHMVVHHGTHIDAPRHFIADGPTMDEVPLELDDSSGAPIAQLVPRCETANFYAQALAVLGADEAVLLRRVEPKHGAAVHSRNRQLDPLAHHEPRSAARARFAEA